MQLIKRDNNTDVTDNILVRATHALHRKPLTKATTLNDGSTMLHRLEIWTFLKTQDGKVVRRKSTHLETQNSLFSLSVTIPVNVSGDALAQIQQLMPSRWQINAILVLALMFVLLLLAIIHQVGRTIGLAEIILLGVNDLVRGSLKVVNRLLGIR